MQIFVSIATELQPPNSKQNNKDASLIKVTEVKVIISSTSVCSDVPYASDLPFKQGAENTKNPAQLCWTCTNTECLFNSVLSRWVNYPVIVMMRRFGKCFVSTVACEASANSLNGVCPHWTTRRKQNCQQKLNVYWHLLISVFTRITPNPTTDKSVHVALSHSDAPGLQDSTSIL